MVVYPAAAADRLPELVAGVGALGWGVAAVALLGRRPLLLPCGLVGVGAGYGVFLGLRAGTADSGAPLVAAGLFVAAELGFWSLESHDVHLERALLVRRILLVAAEGLSAALVGSFLLVAAAGVEGGVGLEALGVLAAVLTLAIVAVLAARSRSSTSP